VISFNDTLEAVAGNLTSYNFNAAGIAHALLGYATSLLAASKGNGITAIQGYISSHRTVAKPE
jgi:hypothetical protein